MWKLVLGRDPSPKDSVQVVAYDATSIHASMATSNEMQRWKNFSIKQGLLLYKGRVCVLLDNDIRCQILFECHDSLSVGHLEIWNTYVLVCPHFCK